MRRILPALALAIIFHGALLKADFGRFFDRKTVLPRFTAVTVTMSYRQPEPESVSEIKEKPTKRSKIKPEESVRKPDKPPEPPPPQEAVKIPDEPPPAEETAEVNAPEEPDDMLPEQGEASEEDSQGEAVSNMQVIREAFPLYKRNPPPRYPRVARKRGYQGTVILSVLVDENGRVRNLWVFTSSGYRLLDNAAVKAVRDWVFEPGMNGRKNLAMWVKVPIRFQLR